MRAMSQEEFAEACSKIEHLIEDLRLTCEQAANVVTSVLANVVAAGNCRDDMDPEFERLQSEAFRRIGDAVCSLADFAERGAPWTCQSTFWAEAEGKGQPVETNTVTYKGRAN